MPDSNNSQLANAIAIIGMAGRFPGASSLDQFWQNICEGRDCISHFSPDALEDAFSEEERKLAAYVPARSVIDGAEMFDAAFFGIKPRDAELTDPQQRVFLEICWEAFEAAGYRPSQNRNVGVFAGATLNSYFIRHVLKDRATVEDFTSQFQIGRYSELLGGLTDFLTMRVSYKLGLTGPSVSLNTACSTSLTAVSLACQSLLLHQCDMALAGGVSITFPQRRGYIHLDGGIGSPDGTCRPFDQNAAGTVFGHGAGVVLLKRFEDAQRDGDTIHAVILGSGVNNDGSGKVGFTAPSVDGQAEAMRAAYAMADIDPGTVTYIEGHGTGTPLGDPIEVAALNSVLGPAGAGVPPLHLGSIKANVGHLDAAAGVTSLIKVALALRHKKIPPLAHFTAPNPALDLAGSRIVFDKALTDWRADAGPRRAAVNALGVGGTNVHIVMEEAPAIATAATPTAHIDGRAWHVLPVSAKSPAAVQRAVVNLADALDSTTGPELADVALTLQEGREPFDHRIAVTAASRAEAVTKLRAAVRRTANSIAKPARLVLMLPGQGAQYPNMGRGLYDASSAFKECVDRGLAIASRLIGQDLRQHLFPTNIDSAAGEAIRSTVLAQPALFVIEHAVAAELMRAGAQPAALIGHSLGEFVAAALAGVMSYEAALEAVTRRAQLMVDLPTGAMLAVRLGEGELRKRLPAGAEIAAINGPQLTVASGPTEVVEELQRSLERDDITWRRLHTSHAFHSRMMEPAVPLLLDIMRKVELARPRIKIASTVSGTWLTDEQATSPEYWAGHCRSPVRFWAALETLIRDQKTVLIEAGPGSTLTALARQAAAGREDVTAVHTLPGPDHGEGDQSLAEARAAMWCAGLAVDIGGRSRSSRRRVPLPTYPFERRRYFLEAPSAAAAAPSQVPLFSQAPENIDIAQSSHSSNRAGRTEPAVPMKPSPTMPPVESSDHRNNLARSIVQIMADVSGEDVSRAPSSATFLELGFDSLMLGQIAQRINKTHKTSVSFRQLMTTFQTIDALADHLATKVAPAQTADSRPLAPATATPTATPAIALPAAAQGVPAGASPAVESLFREQLAAVQQVIAAQLAALAHVQGAEMPAGPTSQVPATAPAPFDAKTRVALPAPAVPDRFNTFMVKGSAQGTALSDKQRFYIDTLTARLEAKMPGSKAYTQRNRKRLADPRAASSFDLRWKELVFPIVSDRAKGSRIWDIDGNDYIDVVNGFGQTALGHNPPFVQEAVERQLKDGYPIGPQAHLAGEVTDLICEMTGNERATFCNTGSEAVMAAMRVARAVTGRDKIVFFTGAYHGQFDEVLAKQGRQRALPIAPGIPDGSLDNIVILTYGAAESLEWIAKNGDAIAAVVVEPVQSRRPSFRPREFLSELRTITQNSGSALVFDEVVTGFRVHPGGMQAVYGIRADMATYGKVLGGGLPIGILAGSARFLDALDGGQWQFGDDSVPEVAPTFFAGTFVRHPLTLAAARAVLLHLRAGGQAELDALSRRTDDLAKLMNADLEALGIASRFEHFASWLWFAPTKETPLASLFFPHMRLLGIHVQEGFPWFLTTAHTAADLDAIANSVRESVAALQEAEILPAGKVTAPAFAPQPRSPVTATTTIDPLGPLEAAPSAPMREIYLAAQLGPVASTAFNEGLTLRIDGALDIAALKASCQAVVARHAALRASMGPTGETVHFAPSIDLDIPMVDCSAAPQPEDRLAALIAKDQTTPFDLANGPLIRMRVVKLGNERHALVVCGHHIVFDGWSATVLVAELAEIYNARVEGRQPKLPEPAPLAKALRQIAAPGSAADRYWLERFKSPPEPLELPTDRPRPSRKSFNGSTVYHQLDRALLERIKRFSKTNGITPFATMLSAVQCLLARLTGQNDICVAVPMAGQQLEEGEALVGHLVNFLPIRVEVDPDRTPAEQAKRVRDVLLESYEHQDYTLGQLVARLGLPRTWDRTPITDVQFNLESEVADPHFSGLACQMRSNPKSAVNFDLFFNLVETSGGIRAEIDYSTDLFDAATILRWAGHLETLLEAMTADGAAVAKHGVLPLLNAREIEWLRDGVNRTAKPFPAGRAMHELISDQAAKRPDARALMHSDRSMTYGELERLSGAIARQLCELAPIPGARIAVAVERSCELVAVLLGVWKAGHAFVPLDPGHPVARLGQTMDVGKVTAVIASDAKILEAAPAGAHRIQLGKLLSPAAASGAGLGAVRLPTLHAAAYVIFTSGSTGTPKGVEVSHRALVNFMTSMAEQPGLSERDTLLAVTTVCFDIAMLELFLPLMAGGSVVIANRAQVLDGFQLVDLLHASKANVLQATPSLWRMLLEAGFKPSPSVKMLAGGEPLPRDLADTLLEGGGELWNLYGPTETTIWSSVERVAKGGAITIGRPIANTSLLILDAAGGLAPIGVEGELVIGGEGLANGYLDRPDLTQAAYRTMSIAGAPAHRFYHTGDVGVRLADGRIALKGRRDQQIKLRGFRIELEEIEAALRGTDGVSAAAVCVVRDASGTERLAACIVKKAGEAVDPDELARHLRGRLPDYMIPTLWRAVAALPATANGKLDRKRVAALAAEALPVTKVAAPALQQSPAEAPAMSRTEQIIAEAWAEVLGGAAPGLHDDVMALGVDSLRIFRVVAQLRRKNVVLSASQIFDHPTVAKQAAAVLNTDTAVSGATTAPQLSSYRGGQRRAGRST